MPHDDGPTRHPGNFATHAELSGLDEPGTLTLEQYRRLRDAPPAPPPARTPRPCSVEGCNRERQPRRRGMCAGCYGRWLAARPSNPPTPTAATIETSPPDHEPRRRT